MKILYCLYNFIPDECDVNSYWHCCRKSSGEEAQLGITLAPLGVIEAGDYEESNLGKSFDYIHQYQNVLPWRCMFRCNNSSRVNSWGSYSDKRNLNQIYPFLSNSNSREVNNFYENLPPDLERIYQRRILTVNELPESYNKKLGVPKSIVFTDLYDLSPT